MREIKFRAWIGGKYVYGSRDNECNPSWVLAICKINDIEPYQYTGLKDKTGKEIYEGSICRYLEETIGYPPYDPHFPTAHLKKCVEVTKRKGVITLEPECRLDGMMLAKVDLPFVEIIGSIHKTPELLKGE